MIKSKQFFTLLMLTLLLGGAAMLPALAPPETTYVEPALLTTETAILSVIVTAADSETAAQAVERLGGHVSSNLWLIDAVGATLPAEQLATLAVEPNIISIVNNKDVESAQGP
jgi:hypothetical protein